MRPFKSRVGARALISVAAVGLAACAAPMAGGQSAAISAADKKAGAEADPQLIAEFGGEVTGRQATYVQTIGKNIAVQSGLSNARSDFDVALLNSSVNNAFAIPGGYIYVTRQLTALMNNEAELAGVLGHEVGHVAARHAQKRQSAAQRNGILGVLGQVLSGVIFGNSAIGQLGQQLFSSGSQLLTLKYSRSQETEADKLGITYLKRAGYDPKAMSTVLASLAAQNSLDARIQGTSNQVPEWASTHPDPASRVKTALSYAGTKSTGIVNRDTFLTSIEGLTYDDDPKQGIVDGNKFTHPVYKFAFQAPNGFYLMNGTSAVSINGQSGKGELSTASFNGNLSTYITSVFAGLSDQQRITPSSIQTTTVNGIPAAYGTARVQTSNGQVDVTVFAYQFSNDQAFHFLTMTAPGQASIFNSMYASMRRISAAEAGSIKPRKLDVVTVTAKDTLQSLASRMAYSNYQLERFLVLNGMNSSSRLAVGQKVKLITY